MARRSEIERRNDFRQAQVVAVIAETHRDTSKRSQPFTPADFMPGRKAVEAPEDKQAASQKMLAQVQMINALFGGKDERKP